jgi:hypothetical protein
LPDPIFKPTDVPVPAAVNNASIVSKSVFILLPHVSVEAPTSGFVSNKLLVVVSAMIKPL